MTRRPLKNTTICFISVPSRVGFTHFRNSISAVYLLHMYGRDYNQLYGCMWASGWARAHNVASLLWSTKSEQSERGCASLPLQRLQKSKGGDEEQWEWGWRVDGTGHAPVIWVPSTPSLWSGICFGNPLTLWQKDYILILCLDALQKGPISAVRGDELKRAGRAKQTNE